jgi:hypothetical protein
MFVVKHKDIFTINIELHKINTRQKLDFHVPSVSLTKVQKGVYYSTHYPSISRKLHITLINVNMNWESFSWKTPFILLKSILIGTIKLILGIPSNYNFVS